MDFDIEDGQTVGISFTVTCNSGPNLSDAQWVEIANAILLSAPIQQYPWVGTPKMVSVTRPDTKTLFPLP